MNKVLFIGLGNPGTKFQGTRHNLGVRVLRSWVDSVSNGSVWQEDSNLPAEIVEVEVSGLKVVCMFPLTFMNDSGGAVANYMRQSELGAIVIIHDEMELELGEMRIKEGGSASGHNGVKSIHSALGHQDVLRLRLGVGRPGEGQDSSAYVLQSFTAQEEHLVQENVIPMAIEKISEDIITRF